MADPVSITTGIVTLLGAGGQIGKFLKKVVNLKNDAPDILLAVNNEITDLREVVQMFDDFLQRQYNTADAAPYGRLSVSLDKVKRTLLKLEQLFSYELTVVEGGDLHLRLDKSAWLLAEPKFRAIKDQIRDDKTDLYRGLSVLTHCMIEYLSRRLHVSVETFEERMLQAHDHVIGELKILGYAVQNVSDQQNKGHSLRRIQQDAALICHDGDPVDGLVFAARSSVRKVPSDQDYVRQRFQHNVEHTTTLKHKSGRIAFGEPPIESGSLVSIEDQHSSQAQPSGSIERKLSHRNTEMMLHPTTNPFFREFHKAPLSPNHIEPSDPNLPSGQPQNSMTSLQLTKSHCGSECCCSCHRRSLFRSPSLLGNALGVLCVEYCTSPWTIPTCNSPSCRQNSKKLTYIYAFPQWLWNRVLLAHVAYSQSRGPELCFRMLRVRSTSSDIFRLFRGPHQTDEIIMTGVRRLFDNGEASVLDIDENGASVLRWALWTGCYRTMKLLIEHGADCYSEDSFGQSPFKCAWTLIFSNAMSLESAALLQQLFWDQSHFDSFQFTQLHKANLGIASNTFDMALASTQRFDVDKKDATGRTTLSWACQRGDPLAISQLLRYGANPDMSDAMGRTPLHWAAESSSIESMRLLLAAGANLELQDRDGRTALANCPIMCNLDFATLLSGAGANRDSQDRDPRTSLAHFLIVCNLDFVRLLLGAGANIESQDRWLLRPLHYAAALNVPQVAMLLIERGADVDAESQEGFTAFEYAISRQSQTTIKISLRPTDDATKVALGEDVLLLAALYGNANTLKILRSMGLVDVNLRAQDDDGMTALEIAERRRDNTSTCSKGSTQAPKRDMRAWFEAFKALWDDIETRQERMSSYGSNNNDGPAHDVDTESAEESDEDDEIWEDATESQNPAPA